MHDAFMPIALGCRSARHARFAPLTSGLSVLLQTHAGSSCTDCVVYSCTRINHVAAIVCLVWVSALVLSGWCMDMQSTLWPKYIHI